MRNPAAERNFPSPTGTAGLMAAQSANRQMPTTPTTTTQAVGFVDIDDLVANGLAGSGRESPRRGRRNGRPADDDVDVSGEPVADDPASVLLDLYDRTLPEVYGYLLSRCGSAGLAEDLTAETFLAAVAAARRGGSEPMSTGWLIGTARHKLVDHWRWKAREERRLQVLGDEPAYPEDPWEARLDALRATEVLDRLGAHHRSVLTLRYLDDLPVPVVADHLGRSVHATEALLVRARSAFRSAYEEGEAGDD